VQYSFEECNVSRLHFTEYGGSDLSNARAFFVPDGFADNQLLNPEKYHIYITFSLHFYLTLCLNSAR